MTELEPAALACLERTRKAVLNILMAVGGGIAVSGLLLRWRDRSALSRASDGFRLAMLCGLFVVVIASYLCSRIGASRSSLRNPESRAARFFRAHVLAALVGALAIPLGLVFGWTIRPRLDAVAPFWVAALALGFLALPRAHELDGIRHPVARTARERADGMTSTQGRLLLVYAARDRDLADPAPGHLVGGSPARHPDSRLAPSRSAASLPWSRRSSRPRTRRRPWPTAWPRSAARSIRTSRS